MNIECNKIKIMHMINSMIIGGAEIALLHYVQSLGTKNYKHYVYMFGVDGPLREKIEKLGISVCFGPQRSSVKNPIRFIRSIIAICKHVLSFIRKNKIDIIMAHLGQPNQLAVLIEKLTKIPSFPTIHSTNAFEDKRPFYDPRIYIIRVINYITYRNAFRIVVVSPEIKEIIKNKYHVSESKIILLKNGIVFNKNDIKINLIENIFPESKNKIKIIAAGRLVRLKRYDVFVKAAAKAISFNNNIFFLLAGVGEEYSNLCILIRQLNIEKYFKLLGLRHDVIDLMNCSDIFVIPSEYEGLSIAMIEAMATGLPVIASDVKGLRDYIRHGENGFLFQCGNIEELSDCLIKLITNQELRHQLSKRSREYFKIEYDMSKNI